MKKKFFCLLILGLILFISCQKEESEVIDSRIDNTIPRDSQLANLMKNVVTHDGSFDDIVDSSNCFSINLPYSIQLNGNESLINEIEDYPKLSDSDVIEIQFPITITLSNHTQEVLNEVSDLQMFSDLCKVNDDDIECIDFIYPITLLTFDSGANMLGSQEIGHDSEMFEFMSNVRTNMQVSINYPIDLRLHNGEKVGAQHNSDLQKFIVEVASVCDENDN